MAAFEDQDFSAGPRQVRGSGQAIVAATNDDGVVLRRHDIDISRVTTGNDRCRYRPGRFDSSIPQLKFTLMTGETSPVIGVATFKLTPAPCISGIASDPRSIV